MSLLPSLRSAIEENDETARTIVFEDIELALRIGAYEAEMHAPQRVLLSAELLVLPGAPLAGDDLAEVVNYDAIHRAIMTLADAPHVMLQETLAERVAQICLTPPTVAAVEVYVRKVEVYADCRSVGIRIVRTRASVQIT